MRQHLAYLICPALRAEIDALRSGNTKVVLENGRLLDLLYPKPTDGHNYSGPFTKAEFFERAFDHDKAAKNGLAAGPNVSYVRTFQACAHALRLAAPLMALNPPLDPVGGASRQGERS